MVQRIKTRRVISFILFMIVVCSCTNTTPIGKNETNKKARLSGLWYYLTKDSQYAEVFFNDSTYFYFQDDTYFVTSYEVTESDTLRATVYGSPVSFKLRFVDAANFTAITKFGSTHYTKIPDTVFSQHDWQKIFEESDDKLFQKYRLYYFARWDDIRKR